MQGKSVDVASAYNQWSATYDQVENKTRDLSAAILRAHELPIEGADIVEIGCGTGLNTAWLAQHARTVIALDFSEGMLAEARRKITSERVTFKQCDITQAWPVPENGCDVVVSNLVLEHVAALRPVFEQAARVLRKGGLMFVCELHPAKQMLGKKAVFTDAHSGQEVDFPAYLHDVSEYVNQAIACGLRLNHLGEWRDGDAQALTPPRLLTLTLAKN